MVLELIEDIIVSQMTIGGNFTFILKVATKVQKDRHM